jgi:hypothetical protein
MTTLLIIIPIILVLMFVSLFENNSDPMTNYELYGEDLHLWEKYQDRNFEKGYNWAQERIKNGENTLDLIIESDKYDVQDQFDRGFKYALNFRQKT